MIKIEGKFGISATILADSISPDGVRLTTFEITYPRIILSELNTHGMLCKNSASSRAIPFAKMKENLTGRPVRFGQANPGMQDKGEDFNAPVEIETTVTAHIVDGCEVSYSFGKKNYSPEDAWAYALSRAVDISEAFHKAGYAKQVYNRLTEAFQMMKTVISATEWENFFWLRRHNAADPSIELLAQVMWQAREASEPVMLQPGEWHLPYVETIRSSEGGVMYYTGEEYVSLQDAIAVSSARCAAVSFRNIDYGVEKCREVAEKLVGADRIHGSAFQHQGTPMEEPEWIIAHIPLDEKAPRGDILKGYKQVNLYQYPGTWQKGVSHSDREGKLWSAQFKGWVMARKLIPGENKA